MEEEIAKIINGNEELKKLYKEKPEEAVFEAKAIKDGIEIEPHYFEDVNRLIEIDNLRKKIKEKKEQNQDVQDDEKTMQKLQQENKIRALELDLELGYNSSEERKKEKKERLELEKKRLQELNGNLDIDELINTMLEDQKSSDISNKKL